MANRLLEAEIICLGLRCIFVGGKRGAGKTTCSCALAVQIAKTMSSVLLVSIKSVYNISDIFEQSFSAVPTAVKGFNKLFAVEFDPHTLPKNMPQERVINITNQGKFSKNAIDCFLNCDLNIFAEVMKIVKEKNIDVVVVDAACSVNSNMRWPDEQLVVKKGKFKSQKKKFRNTFRKNKDLEPFSSTLCNTEIFTKLSTMPQIHCFSKEAFDTLFIFVDTVHPFTAAGNKALILNLEVHGVKTFIVVNKMTTADIPRNAKRYIYKLGWNCQSCPIKYGVTDESSLNSQSQVIKLPLWGNKITGVPEITSFSEYLLKPFF